MVATEATIKSFLEDLSATYCTGLDNKILIVERTKATTGSRTLAITLFIANKEQQPDIQRLLDKLQLLEAAGDIDGSRGFLIKFKGTKLDTKEQSGLLVEHIFLEATVGVMDPDLIQEQV